MQSMRFEFPVNGLLDKCFRAIPMYGTLATHGYDGPLSPTSYSLCTKPSA